MKPREPMVMRVLMLMEYRMLEPAPIMRLLTMALTASTSLETRERRLSREKRISSSGGLGIPWFFTVTDNTQVVIKFANQMSSYSTGGLRHPEHIMVVDLSHY